MADDKQKIVDKEFGLTSLSLRNKITVYVLTLLITVAGIYSYITLPKENFPEVEQPTVYVSTVHPGNSPEDMESLITRELEKEINTIEGVDNIQSTSVQDYSAIVIEFQVGIDVDEAVIDVKDAVDRAKSELPSDLKSDPEVIKFSFSENFPILNINLTDPGKTLDELNDIAEYLEDEIEKFPEVSKVNIVGVDEKEVEIKVDPFKLEARKVTFQDIENFSVSITPLKASNKFLIIGHLHFATQGFLGHVQLLRNGTAICIGDAASNRVRVTGTTAYAATDDNYFCTAVPLNFLDSPNTTGTVTYSCQGNYYTSGNSYVNRTHSDRDYSFYEARYSSTMTVMEISG